MSKIKARVIRVMNNESLIVNVGSVHGINLGDEFAILGTTETIVDPITNEELGDFYYTKETLEVVDVQSRYSILAKPSRRPSNVFGFPEPVSESSDNYDFTPINIDPDEIKPLKDEKSMIIHVGDRAELSNWQVAKYIVN